MYKISDGLVYREDGAIVPQDAENSAYAAYLDWVDAGGVAGSAINDAEYRKAVAAKINEAARAHILAIMPMHRQNNTLARSIELVSMPSLSAGEAAELETIRGLWGEIKSIRALSNLAVDGVLSCDAGDVGAIYDGFLANFSDWG
jgi:hypothetical protein